jgi:RNA ligase
MVEPLTPSRQLYDLVDADELAAAIDAKYVKVQTHPDRPGLRILNYTDACMWDKAWTNVTMTCRGLIVDENDVVIARPWRKFFNYGEHADATLNLTAPVQVTDKRDGSLGISYPTPDGPAIAIRGSFASEQAVHATELYQRRYAESFDPMDGVTYLFEVTYPGNRIVIDYGDLDDLILLGAVHIETGIYYGPNDSVCSHWPGPRPEVFEHHTLADALTAPPRPNAEGLVIRYLDGPSAGMMLKLKQADYVQAHRLLSGLTARRLWERIAVHSIRECHPDMPSRQIGQALHLDIADVDGILQAGPNWMDDIRKTMPEEFTAWIDETATRLRDEAASVAREVAVVTAAMFGRPRKEAARIIATHQYRGLVFAALDVKPIAPGVWAMIRPAHERPFMVRGEDVA